MKKRILLLLLCTTLLVGALSTLFVGCKREHTHTYADTWTTSDEMHWKADTCDHGTKSEEGYHSFDGDLVCTVCGFAKESGAFSVTQAVQSAPEGEALTVEGLYAGISDEGAGYEKELLLKDRDSDQLIAVRGVPYGSFPAYGYEKGDLVRLNGTVVRLSHEEGNNKTQNKTYLAFGTDNPTDIADTVLSRGNAMTYRMESATQINSWDDMKKVFNAATLEAYTYVHIKGDVFFNSYAKAGDGVPLHRFCMNEMAGSLSAMKPDGVRAVGLRQNMLEANVPTAMTTYFDEMLGSTSYPGTKGTVDFYAVVTAANSVNFQLTVLEPNWLQGQDEHITVSTQQEIVREIGFAFYRKGPQIYYDQRYRDENPSPERATAQQMMYLDCSSFVNAVYYEAFGVNVQNVPITERTPQTGNYANYAKDNLGTSPDIVGYWETADYTTKAEQKELLDSVLAQLQVGDVVNYRHGKSSNSSGHALLYIGDGMFLHSTGAQATYDSANPDSNKDIANTMEMTHGTVQKIAASALFTDTASNRYLFRNDKSDKMYNFCVIRPLARGLTVTQKTQNRMQYPGLTMEKLVSPGIAATVARGEEITYTLIIRNHSDNSYTGVSFTDVLSEHLSFVRGSDGLTADGQRVSATLSVGPMQCITLRWTAKVKDSAPVGARIACSSTALGGVDIPQTPNTVGAYTAAQLAAVASKARDLVGESFSDVTELARRIYKEALDVDILEGLSTSALMESLFTPTDTAFTLNTASPIAEMAVPRLEGGTLLPRICDIVAIHAESDLMQGDLIFCQWNGQYRLLVYVGNGEFVRFETSSPTATLAENGNDRTTYHSDSFCIDSICSQLRTYELCAVLRPAMRGA